MRAKIKRIVFYGTWLAKFSLLTIFFLVASLPLRLSKKYKNLWIISERPDEARDNGYCLYKWIIENKPSENVRYVLARNSTDYMKMPRKDLIIEPGSAKHYICYILSKYSVSTHMHGACPGKSFVIPFLPLMRKKQTIFLQHGITENAVKFRKRLNAITVCSEQEKNLIKHSNPNYKNKIFITGFCRYDSLQDTSSKENEKIILVMPTFRKWLRDIGRLREADNAFQNTTYFKAWNSFLNNPKLEELLSKNDMKLVFFPHREMQELVQNLKPKNKRIIIGKPLEFDVQTLLKKTSLLITDYSSVFFDFVYMEKPVIFYQFDQGDFFSKHYPATGKPYPLGDVIKTEEPLVKEIENTINQGLLLKPDFKNDSKKFFHYKDHKNCERVYNLIKELK